MHHEHQKEMTNSNTIALKSHIWAIQSGLLMFCVCVNSFITGMFVNMGRAVDMKKRSAPHAAHPFTGINCGNGRPFESLNTLPWHYI